MAVNSSAVSRLSKGAVIFLAFLSLSLLSNWYFSREVLLSAECSPPRLLEIQCRVTSESVRQAGSLPHTSVMSKKTKEIQVQSGIARLLETINNTSLEKHPTSFRSREPREVQLPLSFRRMVVGSDTTRPPLLH